MLGAKLSPLQEQGVFVTTEPSLQLERKIFNLKGAGMTIQDICKPVSHHGQTPGAGLDLALHSILSGF